MTRIFTVYNCGTGFNRDRTDELVANLASRTGGSENRDWMITDGPGSSSSSRGRTPGSVGSFFAKIRGVVSGFGWEDNVLHAMEVIKAINGGSNQKITHINMAGWSRGAITCGMLAHALANDAATRSIYVNIFALDPVPGPGNFGPEQVTIPGNCLNYTGVFQEDEARKIMRPAVPDPLNEEESDTHFKWFYMPGAHNTGVMRLKTEVALIVAYLAHKFLTKHGTSISEKILLTPRDLCELYAKIRIDINDYRKKKGSGLQRKLLGSEARGMLDNPFRETAYFVNSHHRRQFEKVFPAVWRAMGGAQVDAQTLNAALQQVKTTAPTTWISLQTVGIV
jgi:hypothetical protein